MPAFFTLFAGDMNFDRENQRLELIYYYYFENDKPADIELSKIAATKVTAENNERKEAGFHMRKEGVDFDAVEGNWELPLTDIKVRNFEPIEFVPEKEFADKLFVEVTPTITTNIKYEDVINKSVFPGVQTISVVKGEEGTTCIPRAYDTKVIDGVKYYQMIFNYSGYDTADRIILHSGDRSFELTKSE